jgi:hypothetical protein
VIVALVVASLLGFLIPPPTLTDDMNANRAPNDVVYDPLLSTHGFYPPETLADGTTYEWTGAQATLTFPFAANQGRNAHLSMRVASGWAPGQSPAAAGLYINGRHVSDFTATRDFIIIETSIDTRETPNPYLDPAHLQIDIRSSTSRVAGDTRDLGVAVDWIRVQPERSRTEVLLDALIWALIVGLVAYIAAARLGLTWAALFGAGTLLTLAALYVTYIPREIAPVVECTLMGLGWLLAALLTPKRLPALGLAFAAAMVWIVVAGRLLGDWQMDDAYISYRYAWNLVHGHGLVSNVGEIVEGYTNFLWTLVAAAAIAAGIPPAAATLALNIGLTMGLLALTWQLAARLAGGRHLWSLAAVALLLVDGSLLAYGARGSGMEAMPFAFLVLLSIALLWKEDPKTPWWRAAGGLTLGLSVLTRPEGLLVATVVLSTRALADWLAHRRGRTQHHESNVEPAIQYSPLASLLPFLLVVMPYEVWRISFYGYLFPNTFYAKTGTTAALIGRGLYLANYFVAERSVLMAFAAVGVGFAFLRWKTQSLQLCLAMLLLIYGAYTIWVGGDYFPSWRFYVPLLAPLALLSIEGVRAVTSLLPRHAAVRVSAAAVAAILAFVYVRGAVEQLQPDSVPMEESSLHDSYVNLWGSAGVWLRDNTPPGATTAAKGAGAIAYFSDRFVIDVYGLNDLHIGHLQVADMGEGKAGHEKSDPAYVLSRRPDYIFEQWANYFDPVAPQLAQQYRKVTAHSPTGPSLDWLERK